MSPKKQDASSTAITQREIKRLEHERNSDQDRINEIMNSLNEAAQEKREAEKAFRKAVKHIAVKEATLNDELSSMFQRQKESQETLLNLRATLPKYGDIFTPKDDERSPKKSRLEKSVNSTTPVSGPKKSVSYTGSSSTKKIQTPRGRPKSGQKAPIEPKVTAALAMSLDSTLGHIVLRDNKWVQLTCKYCGANANHRMGIHKHFSGMWGLKTHIRRRHAVEHGKACAPAKLAESLRQKGQKGTKEYKEVINEEAEWVLNACAKPIDFDPKGEPIIRMIFEEEQDEDDDEDESDVPEPPSRKSKKRSAETPVKPAAKRQKKAPETNEPSKRTVGRPRKNGMRSLLEDAQHFLTRRKSHDSLADHLGPEIQLQRTAQPQTTQSDAAGPASAISPDTIFGTPLSDTKTPLVLNYSPTNGVEWQFQTTKPNLESYCPCSLSNHPCLDSDCKRKEVCRRKVHSEECFEDRDPSQFAQITHATRASCWSLLISNYICPLGDKCEYEHEELWRRKEIYERHDCSSHAVDEDEVGDCEVGDCEVGDCEDGDGDGIGDTDDDNGEADSNE